MSMVFMIKYFAICYVFAGGVGVSVFMISDHGLIDIMMLMTSRCFTENHLVWKIMMFNENSWLLITRSCFDKHCDSRENHGCSWKRCSWTVFSWIQARDPEKMLSLCMCFCHTRTSFGKRKPNLKKHLQNQSTLMPSGPWGVFNIPGVGFGRSWGQNRGHILTPLGGRWWGVGTGVRG